MGSTSSRRWAVRGRTAAAVALVLLFNAFALSVSNAPSAEAATTGAGITGITPYGGYLGNYIAPDGSRIYCIDSSADWPSGNTSAGAVVNGLTTDWGAELSSLQVSRLNYALIRWGQTDDPVVAAAVNAYLYAYTSRFAASAGQGYAAGAHYVNGNPAVLGAYDTIWNETESYTGAVSGGTATLSIVMNDAYEGTVSVSTDPVNAIGTLTLTGAVIADSGASTATVQNGSVVAIRGVPGDDDVVYDIHASASFAAPGAPGPTLTLYTTEGQQRTIRGGEVTSVNFDASEFITDPLSTEFSPVLTSQVVSRNIAPGDAFADSISVGVAEGSEQWRQRQDGSYHSVLAVGTLYGPFAEQPQPGPVPADAPVVGSEQITLDGPGSYTTAGTLIAEAGGFYSWVWRIAESEQSPITALFLPDGYTFQDQFGLLEESHLVAVRLDAATRASASAVAFGAKVCDTLTLRLGSSVWPIVDGEPVEVVFDGTAYFVPGTVAPAQSPDVPSNARKLTAATITATGEGSFETNTCVTAPSEEGFITWVWKSRESSEYFLPWADDFGVPEETTRVRASLPLTGASAVDATVPATAAGLLLLLGTGAAFGGARLRKKKD